MQPTSKHINYFAFILIIAFFILLVTVLGFLYFYNQQNTNQTNQASKSGVISTQAQVTITKDGFSPATVLAEKGTQITWTNTDSKPHWVESDPYPSGTLLPGLNSGEALAPNDSFSYTVEKAGTFTYHDRLNPLTIKGSLVVH